MVTVIAQTVSDFGSTWWQEMVKNIILSASGLGLGFALYLGCRNFMRALHTTGWRRRLNLAYASTRIGFVIVVSLISELVFRSPVPIPVDWRTILYTVGIIMAAGGYIGVFFEGRRIDIYYPNEIDQI